MQRTAPVAPVLNGWQIEGDAVGLGDGRQALGFLFGRVVLLEGRGAFRHLVAVRDQLMDWGT